MAPGGGGGALVTSGRRHKGRNGSIKACVEAHTEANGFFVFMWSNSLSNRYTNNAAECKMCVPSVWLESRAQSAQSAMRRTPSAFTYAVMGSGSARRLVTPSRVAVNLTWMGG